MRPNVDEYDDIEDETSVGDAGGSRTVSWVVLAVAVGGFASLAYYAYHSGSRSAVDNASAPVIEADAGPIKEAPANPEGEQFANKDKTIYDVISREGTKPEPEKLMPEPERPIVAQDVEDSEDSQPAIEPLRQAPVAAAAPVPATPAAPAVVANPQSGPAEAASVSQAAAQAPAAAAPAPAPDKKVETAALDAQKTEVKSYAAPEMINETTVAGKQEAPKAEEKPKAEAPKKAAAAAKPAKEKPATGTAKVQLGAYGSEAEAQGAWKKLKAKFGNVLTGSPTVVQAEVNGKTYYRLRTTVADAKAACAKVQPCMAVK